MKRLLVCVLAGLASGLLAGADQSAPARPPAPRWWQQSDGSQRLPVENPRAALLPRISVKGNRFVNPAGVPQLFRGIDLADPDKLEGQGQWNRELFAAVKAMGADLVRLPVHPVAWRERTPAAYLKLLDQAVDWCTDLGLYVIIDWHSIGNLQSGMFQAPMYDTSQAETLAFWRTIAMHFKGNHTVAFYELFNEPTLFRGMLGTMTWTQWRELNEEMIGVIRFWDKETIPLVAGFDWAYDLTPLRDEPVRADGIGYVVHPYPNKRSQPWEPKWEENFAFAADTYPVIATEWGFTDGTGGLSGADDYGNRLTRFLEQRGISWTAWVFDAQWGPRMLQSFDGYKLTPFGEFVRLALHRPPAVRPEPKAGP